MAELEISERAIDAGVMAPVQADAITDMLAVAAPIIVAAELQRWHTAIQIEADKLTAGTGRLSLLAIAARMAIRIRELDPAGGNR